MQLLIYDEPVLLDRTVHRRACVSSRPVTFEFAAALNSVPLTVVEFVEAARDYPIVFAGDPDEPSMPAALLGLAEAENLFVTDDGSWAAGTYVPAFLRRYPFVVAEQDQSEQFSVCLERAFLSDGVDGSPLFDADGSPAAALQQAMKFLAEYQGAVERTRTVMQQLRDNHLLVARSLNVERPGADRQSLNGFSVADEARLQKLSAKALKELARTGTLGLLYAHLNSLRNVNHLAQRRDVRLRTQAAEPALAQ